MNIFKGRPSIFGSFKPISPIPPTIQEKKPKEFPDFSIGQRVVFCPETNYTTFAAVRGADGLVTSKQTKGKKGKKKKLLSILVKWLTHRRGVSCFRIRGNARVRSDTSTAVQKLGYSQAMGAITSPNADATRRFEEKVEGQLHDISYCHDCPLRLKRLMATCEVGKAQAIRMEERRAMRKRP